MPTALFPRPSKRRPLLLLVLLLAPAALAATPSVPCGSAFPATAAMPLDAVHPCPSGDINCVDRVIREMDRRFEALASTCDHDAVFALMYLRTTQEFKRAVQEPGFFLDNDYLIRQDVVFANYYFDAYDHYVAGERDRVPEAWRIAFDAARDRAVSGSGNILLGMNAHVNRDLPYVLASLGLTFPDGSSRKPDHDKVNDFLWRVIRPGLDEAARRFDPSIDDSNVDGTTLDEYTFFQMLVAWREGAWHNAVRLAEAETQAEWDQVAAEIEASAAATARALQLETAYVPPLTTSAARDAWCAEHWDEAGYGDPTSSEIVTVSSAAALLPEGLSLSPAFPNPFNPQTTFSLAVPTDQHVRVEVFDLLGRRVALLHDGPLAAGTPHRFAFEASRLPSGTYLLRAEGEAFARQQQITLLK